MTMKQKLKKYGVPVVILIAITVFACVGAFKLYDADDYKRILLERIDSAIAFTKSNTTISGDCFEKKDCTTYYFKSEDSLSELRQIVSSGSGVTMKPESLKPVVVEVVVDDKKIVLQGNYLILTDIDETAAVKITEEKNKELWKIMEAFPKK